MAVAAAVSVGEAVADDSAVVVAATAAVGTIVADVAAEWAAAVEGWVEVAAAEGMAFRRGTAIGRAMGVRTRTSSGATNAIAARRPNRAVRPVVGMVMEAEAEAVVVTVEVAAATDGAAVEAMAVVEIVAVEVVDMEAAVVEVTEVDVEEEEVAVTEAVMVAAAVRGETAVR